MGQYFTWVNIDKHESLDGCFWGYPPTFHGRCLTPCEENQAMLSLLASRWRGDVVVFYGDYAHFDKAKQSGCKHIQSRIDASGWSEEDFIYEARDATGNFKIAKNGSQDGRDFSDEGDSDCYNGPFDLDIEEWRYVVNPVRREYIDYQNTPVVFASERVIQRYDPLPLLLASVAWTPDDKDGEIEGRWLGDVVYPTNDAPGGEFVLVADDYVDWGIDWPVLSGVTDDELRKMMADIGIGIDEGRENDMLALLIAKLEE